MFKTQSVSCSSITAKTITRKLHAALLILLFVTLLIDVDSNVSARGPLNAPVLKTAKVSVAGPGALYIGKSNEEIRFWMLSDVTARLVDKVSFDGGADQPLLIEIALGHGVSGVFYGNELPLSDGLKLKFDGTLSNKKCPECTVVMPMASESWSKTFGDEEGEVKVSGREGLELLLAQQTQIFGTAGKIKEQMVTRQADYINRQKEDLRAIYEQMKSATEQGEQLLDSSYAETMGFANQIGTQVTHDTGVVQNTADLYANFLLNQTPRIQTSTHCAKIDDWWLIEKSLERDLRIADYPDPLPAGFDEETFQPLNREIIIKQYEDSRFPKLQNQLRPCILNLLGGLYTETDDVSFPGSVPDLSSGNLVSPVSYETIGTNMSDFVDRTDVETAAFETSQETKFNALDKLAYYQEFEREMESLPKPLLKYVGEEWLRDEPAAAEMSMQKSSVGQTATSKPGPSASAAKLSIPTILSQCANNPVVTFHIAGVSILIGTPFNDEITGDNGKNLIIALRGDDCVDAMDDMDGVLGMSGKDTIYGGKGHGVLLGGKGDDVITGGKGESYKVIVGPVELTFDIGSFISGDAGSDTIYGTANSLFDLHGYSDVILGDGLASAADSGDDVIDGVKGINVILGQRGNDTLKTTGFGRVGVDGVPMLFGSLFFAGEGNDTVTGTDTPPLSQSLGDLIIAGADDDTVSAGKGRDFVFGNDGADILNGNGQDDFIFAGRGADTAHGDDGREIISGGPGEDTLHSDAGVFTIVLGRTDKDRIYGGPGVELALGNDGSDEMSGNGGPFDLLAGMQGDDTINGEAGMDGILAGAGNDKVYTGSGPVNLVFAGIGLDYVEGGAHVDVIFGQSNFQNDTAKQFCSTFTMDNSDRLFGKDGTDLIWGNRGCDAIDGGLGINFLSGGDASDLIEGGPDTDLVWSGDGKDTVNTNDGIDIAFAGDEADVVKGFGNVDLLVGGPGADQLSGGDGADILIGSTGDDTLTGDNGPNLLIGGDGKDTLTGGNTVDISFAGNDDDSVNGADGFNFSFGGDQNDTLTGGNGTDVISGEEGDDQISDVDGSNLLFGGGGNEGSINGGSGFDLIFCGPGDDNANGGAGNNVIFANAGNDNITAGPGRTLAFGGDDPDIIHGGCSQEAPRDYIFGNGGGSGNNLKGSNDKRDILVGGSKSRC